MSIAGRCADCRYFVSAPALLEARLPGLPSLGSAYGAVRGDDGLCDRHQRYLRSSSGCAQFERDGGGDQTPSIAAGTVQARAPRSGGRRAFLARSKLCPIFSSRPSWKRGATK